MSEETGESSCRFESRVTKLLEHFPELGGILVGHGDLSISRIKKFRDVCKVQVEVEGDMFVFNVPHVGEELICKVKEIRDNYLVCSPSAMMEGMRVEVDLQGVELKGLYPGREVVCRVNHVADEAVLCIFGSFVKIYNKIFAWSSDGWAAFVETPYSASSVSVGLSITRYLNRCHSSR